MLNLILRDNTTHEDVMVIKTSLALLPKDSGVPFSLVEFPDLETQIKRGVIQEEDVTPALKDLNYQLKKSTIFTIAELKVITDRNSLSIFTDDGVSITGSYPATTTTTTTTTP